MQMYGRLLYIRQDGNNYKFRRMIAYIIIIIGLWALNAFTTDDRYSNTKAMFWLFELVLLFQLTEGHLPRISWDYPLYFSIAVPPFWILKDAFLNYFGKQKKRGWRDVFMYGGNPTGDYASIALWWIFEQVRKRNWLKEPWYLPTEDKERMKKLQPEFDQFQFKFKLWCLGVAAAIFATIKIVNEGLL